MFKFPLTTAFLQNWLLRNIDFDAALTGRESLDFGKINEDFRNVAEKIKMLKIQQEFPELKDESLLKALSQLLNPPQVPTNVIRIGEVYTAVVVENHEALYKLMLNDVGGATAYIHPQNLHPEKGCLVQAMISCNPITGAAEESIIVWPHKEEQFEKPFIHDLYPNDPYRGSFTNRKSLYVSQKFLEDLNKQS